MSTDRDDPVLDACLDEVLAGKTPPDLTPRILQAAAARGYSFVNATAPDIPIAPPRFADDLMPEPPPVLAGLPRVFDSTIVPPTVALHNRSLHRQRSSAALAIGLAAGVIGLGLAIGIAALVTSDRSPFARRPDDAPNKTAAKLQGIAKLPPAPATEGARSVELPEPTPKDSRLAQQSSEQPSGAASLPSESPTKSAAVAAAPPPRQYPPPTPDGQIVSFVNAELDQTWTDAGVKPTPAASDSEWCQRLFSRLLGRTPTTDEQKSFADDKTPTRREKLVDRLLNAPSFSDEFARHWSTVLTNVFLGKRPTPPGTLTSRDELQKYFFTALSANKPYDQIARDLLTATGSSRPGADDYNPAVNFLLDGLNADATVATSRVSRVLLGHQLLCAQCHQHPTQQWSQDQFWSLNACFRRVRSEPADGSPRMINIPIAADAFYETPDGLVKTAQPRFLDGTPISPTGDAAADPRVELARLVTQSDDFAKATANRIWSLIYDYGFTRPVDDLGPNSSSADPQVLARLATEFAAHGFDLKRLIRWTVLSEPFNRSSTISDLASKDMPEEGELALFSRYYSRTSQAPPAAGALVQAVRIRRAGGSASDIQKARIDWLTQANKAPAKLPGKTGTKGPAPAPSVMPKIGGLAHRSVSGDPTGLVKKLAASSMPFEKKIDHLFLAALARQPSPPERRAAQELLAASQDNHAPALEDTWWALLNSSECLLDH